MARARQFSKKYIVFERPVLTEAKYYLIEPLIKTLESINLNRRPKHPPKFFQEPTCSVPFIQTTEDETTILHNSKLRPTVLFCYNRNNNKFSYASNSNDMLLKHIDMFDKLTKQYHRRIIFAKDTVVSDDICSWHFYDNGKKSAAINCATIIYAMEKKQLRIEFPESRILENILNIMMGYENGGGECDLDENMRSLERAFDQMATSKNLRY